MTWGYTWHMKTAISLPDPLFEQAERFAQRLEMSRSQLYSQALQEYLERHDDDSITEALNKIYATQPSTLDPVIL